jgi:hypothetical protein
MSEDLFETEMEHSLRSGGRKKNNFNALPLIVFGLILIGVVFYFVLPMTRDLFSGPSKARSGQAEDFSPTITDEEMVKRQLTSFVEQFLMVYYNYSYTLYDGKVREAEAMMTPSFQAKYSVQARNLDFKRKLETNRVSTDAIRIMPNSFMFLAEGNRYYVRLAGVMTFTTGVNGVSGEFPINLLLAIERTDSGFLVDNVERTR